MTDKKLPRSDSNVRRAAERDERQERLAAALRANLAKRKSQQRLRDGEKKKPEG